MGRQGDGYWISGQNGKISKVTRHELWPYEPGNLEEFGLSRLEPILADLKPPTKNQDEIRILLMQAGLIRTRTNPGVVSIQFYCDQRKVKDYLYYAATALESVGEYSVKAWVGNLKYDDAVNMPWKEFTRKAKGSEDILVFSDDKAIGDVPYNKTLIEKIAKRLDKLK